MATLLILEPIFEADFLDCSFGFRPGRSAHDALDAIEDNLKSGRQEVYDADLKGYFDSIPRDKLMTGLETRIADRSVLKLIRMWLEAPVIEEDEQGRKTGHRSKTGHAARRGDLPASGECVPPLVRPGVSRSHRARPAGPRPGWCGTPTTSS